MEDNQIHDDYQIQYLKEHILRMKKMFLMMELTLLVITHEVISV